MSKLTNKLWKEQTEFYQDYRDNKLKLEWGGFDKKGYDELEKLVLKVACKRMQIVEVGSWLGTVSVLLGTIAKKYRGILYCIDHFKGSDNSNLVSPKYIDIKKIFENNIKEYDLNSNVKIPTSYKHQFPAPNFSHHLNNECDFIFIDADHRYQYVKKDIENYLPLVKKGGILAGHDCEFLIKNADDLFKQTEDVDYTQFHSGVSRAVSELLPKAQLTKTGHIWWIRK